MNDTVTIIVGAGAVLDFDHKGISPSVKNIMDEVLKLSMQKVDGGERPLLREINDYIVGKLNQVGRPEINRYIPPQLFFGSLLHVIEMCISYSSCWHKEYLSWLALPEFGTLIQPDDFLKDIQTYDYIRAANELQKTVMSIVNQYDTSFSENMMSERWYRDFWKFFSGRSNKFNLNYDNTIENSLGEYEDGFPPIKDGEDYSRFSAKRYYANRRGVSTIAHLHGQLLFSEAREYPFEYSVRDMVKNKDYQTACKNRMGRQQNPSNQAKEEYVQPYIVSGSRKTEKMTFAPNNVYLSDLTRKVIENKRLMTRWRNYIVRKMYKRKLYMSKIFSNLEFSIFKLYNLVMCNLYTKFVKFLEICKEFSEDLVTESGNVRRPGPVPLFPIWKSSH